MSIRTGAQYRESLRDGREVYLDGERVEDVTTHPAFAPVVETFARLFDLQHDPQYQELLTYEDGGERYSGAWLRPRDKAQGAWRRRMAQIVARETGGLFGRPPDIIGGAMVGALDQKEMFSGGRAELAQNIERLYAQLSRSDLAVTLAFITQQPDRNRTIDDADVPRVVRETADGVVVSGVITVSTFAPYANECFVLTYPRAGQREEHMLFFIVPLDTPGLRVAARPVHATDRLAEHPLWRFGDENDSTLIFDELLVPWERVVGLGHPELIFPRFAAVTEWGHWSLLARMSVKAEILAGLILLLSEVVARAPTPYTQEAEAEALRYLTTIRAFLHAAEERGTLSRTGVWKPDGLMVKAGKAYATEHYRRMIGYIQDLGGQGLIQLPAAAMLDNPVVGPTLQRVYDSSTAPLDERFAIYRTAFDLACSSLGGRQTLLELFNAGPWALHRQQVHMASDHGVLKDLARKVAGVVDGEQARAASLNLLEQALGGEERERFAAIAGALPAPAGLQAAGA